MLVLVFTSQPLLGLLSQSRKPALHTKEHPPEAHTGEAFAGAVQTVPQAPQLRGSVWVLVQLPAHSVSPEAQVARHTPAEQTCPAPQALLHAPQLARSLWVFTSQPFTALPSQLAKPVSQVVSWHAPLVHADAPLEKRQVKPQAPQLLTLVSAVSQPLPALPSQSPKPALHWNAQRPAQKGVALAGRAQALPQAPQFAGSLARSRQAPVQSVWPETQVATQAPAAQRCPAPQALPQAPQLALSAWVFTSQPFIALLSQLAKPWAHAPRAQPELTQLPLALAKLQRTPQPPQLVSASRLVSQPFVASPSQSPKPRLQLMPQAPLAQKAAPLAGVGQALPQAPQAATSVLVLRQVPLQFCVPVWQEAAQVPMAQTWPAPQGLPQAPQFARSLWVSVQSPPQAVCPVGQEHTRRARRPVRRRRRCRRRRSSRGRSAGSRRARGRSWACRS